MEIQIVELSKLIKSPLNVRKTVNEAACEELKASILAHGLMQNLVVTTGKKGRYQVIAGARRLQAMKSLIEDGKLPSDHAVPCQVVDDERAAEMSLAENVVRLAMHPADQFEAFATLIEQGQSAEQVATRFGIEVRLVEKRMKLSRVAPELLAEYRGERLTLECLMAFTVTDDHVRQIAVYESLRGWQRDDASHIRGRLTEQFARSTDKLAKFVTLETYQDAGGTVRTDLFGEESFLENPELLDSLVSEKLKLVEAGLQAEGWGWVHVDRDRDWNVTSGCSCIAPATMNAPSDLLERLAGAEAEELEIADQIDATDDDDDLVALYDRQREAGERLEAIGAELAAFASYEPEQMATAGAYAYIDRDGSLGIERGLVKRQDAKKLGKSALPEDEPKPKGMPESLKRDLEAYRLGVAQAEIAKHPALAFDLLVFKAAKGVLELRPGFDGADIRFNRNLASNASADARNFIQSQMVSVAKTVPAAWLNHDSEGGQFSAFQALTLEQKHAILAYCVASTLQPKLDNGGEPTAYDLALSQTGANVAEHWRPSATNYLNRITSTQLLEIGQEIFGGNFASQYGKSKKSELVALLDKGFANPAKALDPDKVRRISGWLPAGMAFGQVEAEKLAKAKKKKAA